jgi:hypothetical protein
VPGDHENGIVALAGLQTVAHFEKTAAAMRLTETNNKAVAAKTKQ